MAARFTIFGKRIGAGGPTTDVETSPVYPSTKIAPEPPREIPFRPSRMIHFFDPSNPKMVEKAPDIMIASWCGKKFRPERVRARAGWETVPAVRDGELHEIKSAEILQPGPAALTDGVRRLQAIISGWAEKRRAP